MTYIEHFYWSDGKGKQENTKMSVQGWGRWEGHRRSMPSLGAPFSQNIPGSSLDPTLVSLWRLHPQRHDWSSTLFSALSSFQGWTWKFKLPIMAWSFSVSTIRSQPESPHWNKRHSHHPGNYRSFTNSVSGKVVKDPKLEQEMTLVFLSWELQRLGVLYGRN